MNAPKLPPDGASTRARGGPSPGKSGGPGGKPGVGADRNLGRSKSLRSSEFQPLTPEEAKRNQQRAADIHDAASAALGQARRKRRLLSILLLAVVATFALGVVGVLCYYPFSELDGLGRDEIIYVRSNHLHTEFIVPIFDNNDPDHDMWEDIFPAEEVFSRAAHPDVRWYAIGWGERDFSMHTPTWQDATLPRLLHAAQGSADTVLHVEAIDSVAPTRLVRPVGLNQQAFRALHDYIGSSFRRSADGGVERVDGNGFTDHDAFFESNGVYSLATNCNTWTAEGLRAAGVETPLWSGLAFAVLLHLKHARP